jgi:hypothetical protein
MKFLKNYLKFLKENVVSSSRPQIAPPPTKPTAPVKPERRDRRIEEPNVKPGPKAENELSKMVAYTFIAEMSKIGQSIKKFIK